MLWYREQGVGIVLLVFRETGGGGVGVDWHLLTCSLQDALDFVMREKQIRKGKCGFQ